jgi:RNA polymerase sigma-70 factor, ECF subfamily
MPPSSVFRSARRPPPSGPELAGIADEDLMLGVHQGDASAFEMVFARHADAAFSLAYRMCGRATMADDIVQEAFLSLWRSGARYDSTRGSVRSWVLGVVTTARSISSARTRYARGATSQTTKLSSVSGRPAARHETPINATRRQRSGPR